MIRSKELNIDFEYVVEFSICSFVTNKNEYEQMLNSFHIAGFNTDNCEYLYFDNSTNSNSTDAFAGINYFLRKARGKFIIVCHQDIELIDNRQKLIDNINDITLRDPKWGIISNAGGVSPNHRIWYITYPDTGFQVRGQFPRIVYSVDENFMLIKNSANLSLSGNLKGFHLYGTDLCLIAQLLGYTAWAIPFNLLHKSHGKNNEAFWEIRKELKNKYSLFLKGRWIQTTITSFYISGNWLENLFIGNPIILKVITLYNSLKKQAGKI